MPRQPRQLAETGIYHVMLRGVNRDAVFLEDADYERFLLALGRTRDISGCVVLGYCLMVNHVHLILRTGEEPIGRVVKRLGIRYARWFNDKYARVGHLFQDRFLSVPVQTDAQLVTLVRYVWNNPVVAGLVSRPWQYAWSSRRFLDGGSGLVDHAELARVLPPDALAALADAPARAEPAWDPPGWTTRRTTDDVRRLLRRIGGVSRPEEFARLDLPTQRRLIRELRTRSTSYALIAAVIGKSASAVRRLHVAGAASDTGQR